MLWMAASICSIAVTSSSESNQRLLRCPLANDGPEPRLCGQVDTATQQPFQPCLGWPNRKQSERKPGIELGEEVDVGRSRILCARDGPEQAQMRQPERL